MLACLQLIGLAAHCPHMKMNQLHVTIYRWHSAVTSTVWLHYSVHLVRTIFRRATALVYKSMSTAITAEDVHAATNNDW